MERFFMCRSAAVITGFGLTLSLLGAPGAAADAPTRANEPTAVSGDSDQVVDTAAVPGQRYAASKIAGARASAYIYWSKKSREGGWKNVRVKGWLKDTSSDGNWALFRVKYRYLSDIGWRTKTRYIKKTKGSTAPVTMRVNWKSPHMWTKDLKIQVCKKGRGGRICDNRWR
ncbi:hypothetical protein [Nocardiopsis rhodophaea]|uniref:hypothetical protein n=1 Tax=Nocardiopsis rhodophaea TaxID=280238 RepID=UPI0031D8FE5A